MSKCATELPQYLSGGHMLPQLSWWAHAPNAILGCEPSRWPVGFVDCSWAMVSLHVYTTLRYWILTSL
jgi:hypothetical protein